MILGGNAQGRWVVPDEVNVHVPQTIEAYAEAEQLLSIYQNLMSGQTNKPMMGIVYDSLTGAFLLTYYAEEYDRLGEEMEKLAEEMARVDKNSEKYRELFESMNLKRDQREKAKEKMMLDPVVFDRAITNVFNEPQFATLKARTAKYGVPWLSGRALISAAFPEDFDYRRRVKIRDRDVEVIIKDGILIRGILNKDTLGTKDGSIIAEMVKQIGAKITIDFMSNIQFILRDFLQEHGFSVGLDDCVPNDPDFKRDLAKTIAESTAKVIALSGKTTNEIIAERKERKIGEILDVAKAMGDRIANEQFDVENALAFMAASGAKGTAFNLAQMISYLGQQRVSGQRIPANLPGNRALPVFAPNDPDPKARGLCIHSFSAGLDPSEYFFHAQGGREGLTDTAIGTAQTGYLQHQMIKAAEDIHISSDGSVRTADNGIIQFVYGDDGMDASELGTVKIRDSAVPFFRNIHQLAEKINRQYGAQ